MVRLVLTLFTMLVMLPAGAAGSHGIRVNHCETQVRELVREQFGQQVERFEFRFKPFQSRAGGFFETSEVFAYPKECPGWHYFEIYGDEFVCDGDLNRYPRALINYRSSGDGC